MRKHFLKQFEFEYWSNNLILNSLKELKTEDPKAVLLFSHLLSSHCMWLSRLNKNNITCLLFQERTLGECADLMAENLAGWHSFFNNKTDEYLLQTIEFESAWEENPRKRSIIIEDALVHILHHSSYHRGQIVASIKGKVPVLPLSTYIIYASNLI
jgi:uncharacterized damage-inducible protein DinB